MSDVLLGALSDLEIELKNLNLWDDAPPSAEAIQSTAPFAADTMPFNSWLQWLFIPRLRMMVQEGLPLPSGANITAMGEMFVMQSCIKSESLINHLVAIDKALNT